MKLSDTQKRAIRRFLRTALPQVPAGIASVLNYIQGWNLPVWVVPALMFVGATATALDKLFRDLGTYGQE